MTAARRESIRLSPAGGIALSQARYDLRARDGALLCTVTRERAEHGIRTGALELWSGPSGAYLRAVDSHYPTESRSSSIGPDSRHTYHGDTAAAPANVGRLHRHNVAACNVWTRPSPGGPGR